MFAELFCIPRMEHLAPRCSGSWPKHVTGLVLNNFLGNQTHDLNTAAPAGCSIFRLSISPAFLCVLFPDPSRRAHVLFFLY